MRPYVKSICILEGFAATAPLRNLPTGNIRILANLTYDQASCNEEARHEIAGPQISVIGQRGRFSLFTPAAATRILCVEFFAHTASAFFREPLAELNEISVDASDLWLSSGILAELQRAPDDAAIFNAIQNELRARLRRDKGLASKLDFLQQAILSLSHGKPLSINKFAREKGMHRRTLERLFREHVGLSPAAYSRIHRITNAARVIESAEGFAALDYALDHGYYDQAHFNHDFKAIVGLSPTDYRKSLSHP